MTEPTHEEQKIVAGALAVIPLLALTTSAGAAGIILAIHQAAHAESTGAVFMDLFPGPFTAFLVITLAAMSGSGFLTWLELRQKENNDQDSTPTQERMP